MDDGFRRKRRHKVSCSNPLFAKWLEEWRDEAIEKGCKSSYTFNKALFALKKYPMRLWSGEEAKVLDNIGDKTARMLDKKLSDYLSNGGSLEDLHAVEVNAVPAKKPAREKKTSPLSKWLHSYNFSPTNWPSGAEQRPVLSAKETQVSSRANTMSTTAAPKKKRRSTSVKEYVPAHRSGPYAILIALLKAEQDASFKGYYTKEQLITAAQPYADSSFTIPDPGSYYTAWSSVASLIKKNLLIKTSHPPRFSLSQEGVALALKINEAEGNWSINQETTPPLATPPSLGSSPLSISPPPLHKRLCIPHHNNHKTDSTSTTCSLMDPSPPLINAAQYQAETTVMNIQSLSQHKKSNISSRASHKKKVTPSTETITEDVCIIDQDVSKTTSMKYSFSDKKRKTPSSDDDLCIIDDESVCPTDKTSNKWSDDLCIIDDDEDELPSAEALFKYTPSTIRPKKHSGNNEPVMKPTLSINATRTSFNKSVPVKKPLCVDVTVIDSDDSDIDVAPLAVRLGIQQPTLQSKKPSSISHSKTLTTSNSAKPLNTDVLGDPSCSYTRKVGGASAMPHSQSSSSLVEPPDNYLSRLSSGESQETANSQTGDIDLETELQNPLFTLTPGQYEVILCIDNTESSANRKAKSHFRGLLLEELNKNGVKFSVRKLNIGDFVWVAREKVNISHDQLRAPDAREIVLEHIIERKRMDDLASSIIDRRFSEQKFRMKSCGVYNNIYLVEEHGDISHTKISASALRQAITNTQIFDNFFIKEAKDIRESIAYLTVMTRLVHQQYSHSVIKGYPVDTMTQVNKARKDGRHQNTGYVPGTTFALFNESSNKTKVPTVSEMFIKQLIQIPNASSEKAAAIVKLYPTVAHLIEAYGKCASEKERENMLTPLRIGESKRRFGPLLSSFVYKLYWKGTD